MQRAFLFRAQLQGADLSGAQLQNAHLSHAQLQGADLIGAQLQGANVSYAHLQGATLFGALLRGADLRDTQLQGANLCGVHELIEPELKGAAWDSATTWPEYLAHLHSPDGDGDSKEDILA